MEAIKAELLQDATEAQINRLVTDPGWVFQEKHNGDRRFVEKRPDGKILDWNRNGKPGKGLPPLVREAIQRHPLHQFVIDVELVGNQIFVFDALFVGDEIVILNPYSYRESCYHAQFDGFDPSIVPVESARTPEAKLALIQRLKAIHAEGLVAKELKAPYRPGERLHLRFKFWKSLDAVVIGDSKERDDKGTLKDSVRLGCYDKRGMLKDICGATKKSDLTLRPGDVVEVKYLYGTGELNIVQIDIQHQRFDKAALDCTIDQIVVNKNWWRRNA